MAGITPSQMYPKDLKHPFEKKRQKKKRRTRTSKTDKKPKNSHFYLGRCIIRNLFILLSALVGSSKTPCRVTKRRISDLEMSVAKICSTQI